MTSNRPFPMWLAAFAMLVAALWIYQPAFSGPFVSDDTHYVRDNPFVHGLSLENLAAILDPTSVVGRITENYAPVHLLLHAVEWQAFSDQVVGYHIVNVLLHVLCAVLLILLFERSGIAWAWALWGGALFLVHPANVEAVAWISQLKSSASLVLVLGALLLHPTRPAAAALLFGLALLAKPLAAFAFPVALLLGWSRLRGAGSRADDPERKREWAWPWMGVWLGLFLAYAAVELFVWTEGSSSAPFLYSDVWVRARSTVAILGRYLVMAASGTGLSTFHEPAPADSWLNPLWLASLLAMAILGARAMWAFLQGREEAAYWGWAIAGWVPICGLVLPLSFPMADRYLYFILPGLLGAGLLLAAEVAASLAARHTLPQQLGNGLLALGAGLVVVFGVMSHDRAALWSNPAAIMVDAALNYPKGTPARLQQARRAARIGDAQTAVSALEAAHKRGYMRLDQLVSDPTLASLHGDPSYDRLLKKMAGEALAHLAEREELSQIELHYKALAHNLRGETPEAIEALERGLEVGGPVDRQMEADLRDLRRKQR